jgi:phage FluMu gp28-like protein
LSEKLKRLRVKWKRLHEVRKRRQTPVDIPEDPVAFFRDILHLEPYPYQAAFLRDTFPLKVLRWCRRAGKTMVMTGSDLHFAALHPRSVILCTMPKFTQIKEIYFQDLDAGLHGQLERLDGDVYEALIYDALQTIIRFRNKSVIRAEVPEPFTIRGHGPSKINIDEFNFVRKDKDLWLSALLPMTLTKTVYVNVASTPWNKDSIYHQMCFDKAFHVFSGNRWHGVSPDAETPGESRYLKTWRDVLQPHGPLDPQQVEVMREQYEGDPWRWKREMECVFVSDETAFLPSSLIIKCQNEGLEFAPFEQLVEGRLYGGWDLGRERDFGVFAVVNKEKDVDRLVHCKQFPLGTPYVSQMAYIKSLCDRWRYFHAICYDMTGTKGIDEEIDRAGFPGVKGVTFTRRVKHGMATLMKEKMMAPRKSDMDLAVEDQRRQFELPYDKDVQSELNVVQWEQSKGSELYTFSHPEGSHEDRFWAIALAVLAAAGAPPSSIPVSRSF